MSDQERWAKYEAEGLEMHTPEFERQIAETMAERKEKQRAWSHIEVRRRAERRERIATAVAPAVTAWYVQQQVTEAEWRWGIAVEAVRIADEIMVRLDAAEARDREATK